MIKSIAQTAIGHHFIQSLGYAPHCGNAKDRTERKPANEAVERRYIAPNPPHLRHHLMFDIDQEGRTGDHSASRWIDLELPRPHFIVSGSANYGSAYIYTLEVPLHVGPRASTRATAYHQSLLRGYTQLLGADPGYSGHTVKNPLHRHWTTHVHDAAPYTFADLMDALPEPYRLPVAARDQVSEGRNTDLFNSLRTWAYGKVWSIAQNGSFAQWLEACGHQALAGNIYTPRLPRKEVLRIARSVAEWTWKRSRYFSGEDQEKVYRRNQVYSWNRPSINATEAKERMSEGGLRVGVQNAINRGEKTRRAIENAISDLAREGWINPSPEKIAERVGKSIRTVKRYI